MSEPSVVALDGRRRFKALWRELVYARFLTAGVAGLGMWALGERSNLPGIVALVVYAALFAAPSCVAKRGWAVPVAVVLASGATIYLAWVLDTVMLPEAQLFPMAVFAMAGAGSGVAEGQLEKSIATTYCGLLGGSLSGAIASKILPETILNESLCLLALVFVVIHLGIGLSLALGRYVRDLPRRKAAS